MRSNKRKWVIPGLLTVVLGTAGSFWFNETNVETDLTSRSNDLLADSGYEWAKIEFDARDATISGTANNEDEKETAQALIKDLYGVRIVNSEIDTLPSVSPYLFSGKIKSGAVTLSGGAPNDEIRNSLIKQAGAASNSLELQYGYPDKAQWLGATDFALSQLKNFDEGQISLSDLEISASGTAKSREAYDNLNASFASLPAGVILDGVNITPPVESPYLWSAQKSASGDISLQGFVPNDEINKQLSESASVSSLLLAQGEPENFNKTALLGLETLSLLDEGEASHSANGWSIKGKAPSQKVLDLVNYKLKNSGWDIAVNAPLPPAPAPVVVPTPVVAPVIVPVIPAIPTANPYLWSAEKIASGAFNLSGYAPKENLKTYLSFQAGNIKQDNTTIAIGEPDNFSDQALAGIAALGGLEKGRVAFNGTQWSLVGLAKSKKAKSDVLTALSDLADTKDWLIDIDTMAPPIPVEKPYSWQVIKSVGSPLAILGYAPSETIQNMISKRAVGNADASMIALGSPKGFGGTAMAAISALESLENGDAGYDGKNWYINGMLAEAKSLEDISNSLNRGNTSLDKWVINVQERPKPAPEPAPKPEPKPEPVPAPIASLDYRFVATLDADKSVSLNGDIPSAQTQNYVGVLAGKVSTDNLAVDFPAPDEFNRSLFSGIRSLKLLETGQLSYRNQAWYFVGAAKDEETRDKALSRISALANGANWTVNVKIQQSAINACNMNVAKFAQNNAILFDVGKANLKKESDIILQHLALLLNRCPTTDVHVQGHTDSDGSEARNLTLSVDRSIAVVNALVERGISSDRLFSIGYGESMPVTTNSTVAGKKQNRRTVFSIYKSTN